jgi:hypothetical protein
MPLSKKHDASHQFFVARQHCSDARKCNSLIYKKILLYKQILRLWIIRPLSIQVTKNIIVDLPVWCL